MAEGQFSTDFLFLIKEILLIQRKTSSRRAYSARYEQNAGVS